jgi:insulysin
MKIVAMLLFATSIIAAQIEDLSFLPMLNPDLADRKTSKLILENGVEVLLISDPNADQSAASVSMRVGSWNDPLEYAGMAHFCEHMLFMGTEKYPNENEFHALVGDYGGSTNAFTAPHQTVYMFSSQTKGFLPILDRFAHFFIDPLFNPANIAREMHAVDQEFAKNLENDGWREYQVFKELGNPNHPNRLFSTGNSQTLAKIPQSALKKWHSEHYGADRMHLVIYSSLPIETLEQTVSETFNAVPPSKKELVDSSSPLLSAQQIGHITYVKAIKKRQNLSLAWELPEEFANDPTKSAQFVAYLLKRGQKYSLYEKLKSEQLIDAISVSIDEMGGKEHRFFQISLELSQKGTEQISNAIAHCFEAIAGLKITKIPAELFEEKNIMAQLNYQYQGRQDPFDYIMKQGASLSEEELETYPRNTLLGSHYDPKKVKAFLDLLTPQTCAISYLTSSDKVAFDKKEKWLNADYTVQPIPSSWIAQWQNVKPNPQIRLTETNPFVPTHLALVTENPISTPISISDSELGSAYYVRSPEFGAPETVFLLNILTPEITSTARGSVLTSLYIDHLTDLLAPTITAAQQGGLGCGFSTDRSRLRLTLTGYSEKAPLPLQEIPEQIVKAAPPTPDQFAQYIARHEKAYSNSQKDLAARQAWELLDTLLNQDKTTQKEKLAALKTIRYDDYLNFQKNLFKSTYLEAFFAGNLTLKKAESCWLDVVHALVRSPYPKADHPQTKILHLSDKGPFKVTASTEAQGNATLLLLDQGPFTFESRAAQEILSSSLKEAFFTSLRTKQKTGYIAQSDSLELEEHLFQYFVVQSNSHQTDDLLHRFEQFLESYNDNLAEKITPERFETLRTSQISSLKNRFRNLQDKTALWNSLAFIYKDFDFINKRIAAYESLNYETFIEMSKKALSRNNRKRLAVLFDGKLPKPFIYQTIVPNQLAEIASYEIRKEKN